MKKIPLFFLSFGFGLTGACQHSPTVSDLQNQNLSSSVTCKLNSDTRIIEILPYQSTGCHVNYTKFKTAKTIATAHHSNIFCQDVREKMIANLKNSGFHCE